jgi:hypothetical protein
MSNDTQSTADASTASVEDDAQLAPHIYADPRDDLPDHERWRRLFRFAAMKYGDNHGLLGALHGLRACGAVVKLHANGETFVIEPTLAKFTRVIGEEHPTRDISQWETREQYNEDRKVLLPYVEEVKWLLRALVGYEKQYGPPTTRASV